MSYKFELHIQCSKDISKINIDFVDGTSILEEVKNPENIYNQNKKLTRDDILLNIEDNNIILSQEIIEKPEIKINNSGPNVAQEMQNLEI